MASFTDLVVGRATGGKASGLVPVDIGGVTVQVVADRDVTYTAGDLTVVAKIGSAWYALTRIYANVGSGAAGNDTPPPPNPGTGLTSGTLTVAPVETRSYRTSFSVGWRTDDDDIYHGQYGGFGNHYGCVFYGDRPRSLAGATVTGATVRLRVDQIGAYPPTATTMRLMTNTVRPGGAPTLTSTVTGPAATQGSTLSFTVPTAWAQSMVDGSAGGLAFYDAGGSPYVRMAGRSRWSPAGTLTINWRR